MLIPRFTIRTALAVVTGCAVLFLMIGTAYRGQTWAWGVTIAAASLLIAALVHAGWFGVVWLFTQLPSGQPPMQNGAASFAVAPSPDSLADRPRPGDAPHMDSAGSS